MLNPSTASASDAVPSVDCVHVMVIGVSKYPEAPSIRPVPSATDSALGWLLQGLRMGAGLRGNYIMVDEAEKPADVARKITELLSYYDLSSNERQGLTTVLGQVQNQGGAGWEVYKPTMGWLLERALTWGGNMVRGSIGREERRLLISYAGHGTLAGGELCLCTADTKLRDSPPPRDELDAGFAALQASLTRWPKCLDLTNAAWAAAAARSVSRETLDCFRTLAHALIAYYPGRPDVVEPIMKAALANIVKLPARAPREGIALDNVLTWAHFQILMGDIADRITLVLDACHSGGPGDGLQGSLVSHGWIDAGFGARILSASSGGTVAAEARLGERTYPVASWALTRVLSRWHPVKDGPRGYALGIRNGELVHRANMLLEALSFRQQVSLHAPPSDPKRPSVADMPFCGLFPDTRTTTEPDEVAGSIQLSAGGNEIRAWYVTSYHKGSSDPTDVTFVLLAVGAGASDWTFNGQTYTQGQLYVLGDATSIASLNEPDVTSFKLKTIAKPATVDPQCPWAVEVQWRLSSCGAPKAQMPAVNDPGEIAWATVTRSRRTYAFRRAGGGHKQVILQFLKAEGGACAAMRFGVTSPEVFPFDPSDFNSPDVESGTSTFSVLAGDPPAATSKQRWIDVS